ncbi:glutathione S-transferase family protein [Streptococcus sciuri]|uniref:Glutathione S-transferase family protein n=1 Tax=Streptococcus sciuri TaxID=2973939 RepID=A0ABT2F5K3_9STRE|nr:glutathione S-transferase family protein [Streptococcus sciuri]MCS4487761.1 glutathione S-transferase family protein [Streptococcus sciuri]
MGLLVNGVWQQQSLEELSKNGNFVKPDAAFKNWVTADGSAGPTGVGGFKAEKGRYHLVVSYACPWASRTLVMRVLKDLEDIVSLSVVNPLMLEQGWTFEAGDKVVADPIMGADYLHQLYTLSNPDYTGRVSVPILWDKKTGQIVSNESADIMRMFNSAFNDLTGNQVDYYPESLREQIEQMNEWIYTTFNQGVYKAGMASSQSAYEKAVTDVFETMEKLNQLFTKQTYLLGDKVTEADWRLFTTLVRFDAVYYGHFKCNLKRLVDFPNLWNYTKRLYHQPKIADTVHLDHVKIHYYGSHRHINPTGIVPLGPDIDWSL